MENTIQIVKQTSDGLVFNTKQLFNTLDKIGDKNIAIVSITGKQSTGKSLLLNQFLRFLKRNESNKDSDLNGFSDSVLKEFELRAGDHNAANGIWMWSEPIVVTANDGSEMVLLLLETRCDFECKDSSHESGIIFAISLLLSSTLIVNIRSGITEDVLKFVEYYTCLAQSLNDDSNSEMFQRLIFVVRDWEREWLYRFGYHYNNTTDINNYMQSIINPNANQCIEKRITRKRLLSYFDDISSYLLPHPGKSVTKPCFCGQIDLIDRDFSEKAEEFVKLTIDNLTPKSIGGENLNGISLKQYLIVDKWQQILKYDKIAVKSFSPINTSEFELESESNPSDDEVEESEQIIIACSARSVQPMAAVSQRSKYLTIKLPCPGFYNHSCDREQQYWVCDACSTLFQYGFDGYFYCECGKADVYSFEFKCNSIKHSSKYIKFTENILKQLLSDKEINILIVGETGVGKSTWINGLVNYLSYTSLEDASQYELLNVIASSFTITDNNYQRRVITCGEVSETQQPNAYVFEYSDKIIRIIATPGIGDTRGIDDDKKNFDSILRYLTNLNKLHGICILLKPNNNRLGVMFRFFIKELLTHLHRDASRNIVFCFTNARSTFYRPGDTLPALKALLNENMNVKIEFSNDTIYCMDNESFRFLCALRHGIEFDEKERKDYSNSWDKCVVETKRMLDYICSLTPLKFSNSLSLIDTRKNIISLTKPLADINRYIIDVQNEKNGIINSPESYYMLRNEKTMKKVIEQKIQRLELLVNELNDEKDMITKISAKFGSFIKANSIVPYNDARGAYLEVLIRIENNKVSAGGDRKTLNGLEQIRKEYMADVRLLKHYMTLEEKYEQLSANDLNEFVNRLYLLKHNGKELKQIVQYVTASKSKKNKCKETINWSNKKPRNSSS